ncbi:MAG: hypothetical protein ACRC5M_04560 [Anaeroplasmataceae bacterium]
MGFYMLDEDINFTSDADEYSSEDYENASSGFEDFDDDDYDY